MKNKARKSLIGRFDDRSGAQTTGAYHHTAYFAGVFLRSYFLQIRVETAFGFVVGMADIVAGRRLFATNFTLLAHKYSPCSPGFLQYCADGFRPGAVFSG